MELSAEQKVRYLTRRKDDLVLLYEYIENSEFEKIGFLAHKIKGSGSTFGFPFLTNIAKEIELSLLSPNRTELLQLINQFNNFIISELKRLRP